MSNVFENDNIIGQHVAVHCLDSMTFDGYVIDYGDQAIVLFDPDEKVIHTVMNDKIVGTTYLKINQEVLDLVEKILSDKKGPA